MEDLIKMTVDKDEKLKFCRDICDSLVDSFPLFQLTEIGIQCNLQPPSQPGKATLGNPALSAAPVPPPPAPPGRSKVYGMFRAFYCVFK